MTSAESGTVNMSNMTGTTTEWEDKATTAIRLTSDKSPTIPAQDGIPVTAVVIMCIVVAAATATAAICAVFIKRRKSSSLTRTSSASRTIDNLQPERPSSLGPTVPEAAGQTHGDRNTEVAGTNTGVEQSHQSSDVTVGIHNTTSGHVPSGHLTDRYIFRESGRAFSSISNRSFEFNSALCTDSCWDRLGRQSDRCPSGLSPEVLPDVIGPGICSRYEGLVLRAGLPHTDHSTYLHVLYRASEALSSDERESVIYDVAIHPGRASHAVHPDRYTYLDVLRCSVRSGSVDQSESVIYDIITDLGGAGRGTSGQYTHIYNVRRTSELHTRPLLPSGEYALPFELSITRHSFETSFDAPSCMHPLERSSLARYSPESGHYDMPIQTQPVDTSSLTRYSSASGHYDMPVDL